MDSSCAQASLRPVVSVVVLCYNQAAFVGECLESILVQQLDVPFDIIVGDDGSKDNSLEVVESYRERYPGIVKVVAHATNGGFSRNLADALAAATGEFIANIDGDDLMLPGKLQRQLDFLRAHPEYGLVVHKMRMIDANTKEPVDFPLPRKKPEVFGAEYLIEKGPFFFHSSEMYRAELRRRHPVDLNVTLVGDVANLLQLLYGSSGYYLDEEYGLYRVSPLGITSQFISNPKKHENNIKDMLYTYEMAERLGISRNVTSLGRARLYLSSAIFYLEKAYFDEFVRCIEASVQAACIGAKQGGLYLLRHWPRTLRLLYGQAKQLFG
jgi:glycosyltransferase involved in cell wall biosynthesis